MLEIAIAGGAVYLVRMIFVYFTKEVLSKE